MQAVCSAARPNLPARSHTMAQLTGQFQELSRQVRAAEAGLRASGQDELAGLLRTVQVGAGRLQPSAAQQGPRC